MEMKRHNVDEEPKFGFVTKNNLKKHARGEVKNSVNTILFTQFSTVSSRYIHVYKKNSSGSFIRNVDRGKGMIF